MNFIVQWGCYRVMLMFHKCSVFYNHDYIYPFCKVFVNRVFLVLAFVLVVESRLESVSISCNTSMVCSISIDGDSSFLLLGVFSMFILSSKLVESPIMDGGSRVS